MNEEELKLVGEKIKNGTATDAETASFVDHATAAVRQITQLLKESSEQ